MNGKALTPGLCVLYMGRNTTILVNETIDPEPLHLMRFVLKNRPCFSASSAVLCED